jgi:hypothetical protein
LAPKGAVHVGGRSHTEGMAGSLNPIVEAVALNPIVEAVGLYPIVQAVVLNPIMQAIALNPDAEAVFLPGRVGFQGLRGGCLSKRERPRVVGQVSKEESGVKGCRRVVK